MLPPVLLAVLPIPQPYRQLVQAGSNLRAIHTLFAGNIFRSRSFLEQFCYLPGRLRPSADLSWLIEYPGPVWLPCFMSSSNPAWRPTLDPFQQECSYFLSRGISKHSLRREDVHNGSLHTAEETQRGVAEGVAKRVASLRMDSSFKSLKWMVRC